MPKNPFLKWYGQTVVKIILLQLMFFVNDGLKYNSDEKLIKGFFGWVRGRYNLPILCEEEGGKQTRFELIFPGG